MGRALRMPSKVNADAIKASFTDGVLTLTGAQRRDRGAPCSAGEGAHWARRPGAAAAWLRCAGLGWAVQAGPHVLHVTAPRRLPPVPKKKAAEEPKRIAVE